MQLQHFLVRLMRLLGVMSALEQMKARLELQRGSIDLGEPKRNFSCTFTAMAARDPAKHDTQDSPMNREARPYQRAARQLHESTKSESSLRQSSVAAARPAQLVERDILKLEPHDGRL